MNWRPSCKASERNYGDLERNPSIGPTHTNALVSTAIGIAGSVTRYEAAVRPLRVITASSPPTWLPFVGGQPGIRMLPSRVTRTWTRYPVIRGTAPGPL